MEVIGTNNNGGGVSGTSTNGGAGVRGTANGTNHDGVVGQRNTSGNGVSGRIIQRYSERRRMRNDDAA